MQSKAQTVSAYIKELPSERRKIVEAVRRTIKKHLPKGYQESMQYGMISYCVPLKTYPKGYLGNSKVPLCYAALASQKNYTSLYLMNVYGKEEKWFRDEYRKSGKKLDMGKSCVRFKSLDDLPLAVIGKAIARTSVPAYIEMYEAGRAKKK
jgi:hypothetical protein